MDMFVIIYLCIYLLIEVTDYMNTLFNVHMLNCLYIFRTSYSTLITLVLPVWKRIIDVFTLYTERDK